MNIQAQKVSIIEQFKQLHDTELIQAIQSLLDYALKKEQEGVDIPETHQKPVMDRFHRIRKNPERLLNWDEVRKTLKT